MNYSDRDNGVLSSTMELLCFTMGVWCVDGMKPNTHVREIAPQLGFTRLCGVLSGIEHRKIGCTLEVIGWQDLYRVGFSPT